MKLKYCYNNSEVISTCIILLFRKLLSHTAFIVTVEADMKTGGSEEATCPKSQVTRWGSSTRVIQCPVYFSMLSNMH